MIILSKRQEITLMNLCEDKVWPNKTAKGKTVTLNSLHRKGLVRSEKYGNGFYWELTQAGLEHCKTIK
jgi:hypothetical protein